MRTADPLSDNALSNLEIAARNYLMDAFVYGEGLDPGDPAIRDWLLEQTVELGFQLSQALQAYVGFGLEFPQAAAAELQGPRAQGRCRLAPGDFRIEERPVAGPALDRLVGCIYRLAALANPSEREQRSPAVAPRPIEARILVSGIRAR